MDLEDGANETALWEPPSMRSLEQPHPRDRKEMWVLGSMEGWELLFNGAMDQLCPH